MKRILIFLTITFALSWIYEFAVVYPFANGDVSQSASMEVTFAIGAVMFFPAIGVVLTRLITREGFKNCVIKPYPWRRSLPWFLVAWFGPSLLIAFGAATYFLLFPGDFDPQGSAFAAMLESQAASAGVAPELPSVAVLAAIQIAVGVFLGPLLNIATTFGEEWGWRGYLMPKLANHMRITPALMISGVIWGLWHAPITALGHNYGLGYPGWPVTGVLAMCAFCVVCGIFLSYVTIRTRSCLAAAFGHGAINALAGASTIFAVAGTSPFIGPSPTGIIGGCGLIIVAVIMLADLRKREKNGTLRMPEAGMRDNGDVAFCHVFASLARTSQVESVDHDLSWLATTPATHQATLKRGLRINQRRSLRLSFRRSHSSVPIVTKAKHSFAYEVLDDRRRGSRIAFARGLSLRRPFAREAGVRPL